jgi:NTP pyrophosphatase (non-canonical NTP hydrolase)
MSDVDSLERLRDRLRTFAAERNWERHHIPKNLAMALAGEAGELAAVLQWATPDEPIERHRPALEEEIADVLIYLVRLCDVVQIDPVEAANSKADRNDARFPVGGPLHLEGDSGAGSR